MGTHSYIAKQIGPNQYRTVYCQLDGHLEYQGAMLLEHFSDPDRIDQLLDLGDIYLLEPKLDPDASRKHDCINHQDGVTVAFQRDADCTGVEARVMTLQELDNSDEFIEFVYIFNQNNQWQYFQGGYLEEGLRDVKADLQALEEGLDIIKPPPFDILGDLCEGVPEEMTMDGL